MSNIFKVFVKKQAEGIASHELLRHSVSVYTGTAIDESTQPAHTEFGKPYFAELPGVHFSISHSGDIWACAIGAAPVGLDIQKNGGYNTAAIAERFFHLLECEYLKTRGFEEFFRIWAAKESYCKYLGCGINENFSKFSVSDGKNVLTAVENAGLYRLTVSEGYEACLCAENIGGVEIVYINIQ